MHVPLTWQYACMHACTCTVCGTGGELELGDSVRMVSIDLLTYLLNYLITYLGGELELGDSVRMVSIDQTREGLTDDNSVFEEVTGG